MSTSLETETLIVLRRILRASDRNTRNLAAATGMTPSQLLVLQEVLRRGETTPTVIATTLKFGQATVTNIVDRLEEEGFLTRTRAETDKRRFLLRLTDSGRSALDAAPDLLQDRFRNAFVELPSWEQAMILASLERLANIFSADDHDAAPLIDHGVIDRVAS
ncbi:MAG: winged helix-turn-helix transcriptional regulator [Novosphingobium sp.]|nr:winged helix-turn-helix transcriptional regulator [Novosphingobium sp.]